MSVNENFSLNVEYIILYKFDALVRGNISIYDMMSNDRLNIINQVREISIFESIFSHNIKAEISVVDQIGLFYNFPIVGDEIIHVVFSETDKAKQIKNRKSWFFMIDYIGDISVTDHSKSQSYIIYCKSVEDTANSLSNVMKAYNGTPAEMIGSIFDDYIVNNVSKFIPEYYRLGQQKFTIDSPSNKKFTFVVPNVKPLTAIEMITDIMVSDDINKNQNFLFYQNSNGFNVRSLQGLFRTEPKNLTFKYVSDQKLKDGDTKTTLKDNRDLKSSYIITDFIINSRYNNFTRLISGYYNHLLYQVNPFQKAVRSDLRKIDQLKMIDKHPPYSKAFKNFADSVLENDSEYLERANLVEYFYTIRKDNDEANYPHPRLQDRVSFHRMALGGLSTFDLTIVIPGTDEFVVGDMIKLQFVKFQGFTSENDEQEEYIDNYLSGIFIITEIKHVIFSGGFHSTTMKVNKDSYNISVDREMAYKKMGDAIL